LYNGTVHQMNILLCLDECHWNYKNTSRFYAERYPDRHPNPQQVINIEKRSRQNPLH